MLVFMLLLNRRSFTSLDIVFLGNLHQRNASVVWKRFSKKFKTSCNKSYFKLIFIASLFFHGMMIIRVTSSHSLSFPIHNAGIFSLRKVESNAVVCAWIIFFKATAKDTQCLLFSLQLRSSFYSSILFFNFWGCVWCAALGNLSANSLA